VNVGHRPNHVKFLCLFYYSAIFICHLFMFSIMVGGRGGLLSLLVFGGLMGEERVCRALRWG
jgi:hypothetical protein